MKEKIIVAIIAILVLIGAIFTAKMIKNDNEVEEEQGEKTIISEEVTDECTEEYKTSLKEDDEKVVSSSEEKVSANSAMILKKYYKQCGHTINEYLEVPKEIVNMTQEEVTENFPDWELIGFASNEITLFKEENGSCGEHFRLREEERKSSHL